MAECQLVEPSPAALPVYSRKKSELGGRARCSTQVLTSGSQGLMLPLLNVEWFRTGFFVLFFSLIPSPYTQSKAIHFFLLPLSFSLVLQWIPSTHQASLSICYFTQAFLTAWNLLVNTEIEKWAASQFKVRNRMRFSAMLPTSSIKCQGDRLCTHTHTSPKGVLF